LLRLRPRRGVGIAAEIHTYEPQRPTAESSPRSAVTRICVDCEPSDERAQRVDLDDAPEQAETRTRGIGFGCVVERERGIVDSVDVARDAFRGAVARDVEALPPLVETAHDAGVARDAVPSIRSCASPGGIS